MKMFRETESLCVCSWALKKSLRSRGRAYNLAVELRA